MPFSIRVVPHPLLEVGAFLARLPTPLVEIATPVLPRENATIDDATKTAVRDLLRHGGFKPAGRSKPASEYLAAHELPVINALVDACNVISLRSGLPISVIDLDKVVGELAVQIAPAGTTYAFNPSGQVIDASGLVCLYDANGPTGTPVKDAQRTKTHDGTRNALAIIWGTRALPGRTAAATADYRALAATFAEIDDVVTSSS